MTLNINQKSTLKFTRKDKQTRIVKKTLKRKSSVRGLALTLIYVTPPDVKIHSKVSLQQMNKQVRGTEVPETAQ